MATESKFNCATHDSVVRISDFASVNSIEEAESLITYVKDKFGVDIAENATFKESIKNATTDDAKLTAYRNISTISDLKITEEKEQSTSGSTIVTPGGGSNSPSGSDSSDTGSTGQEGTEGSY